MQHERIGLDRMLDDLSSLFEENRLLKQQLEVQHADLTAREVNDAKPEWVVEKVKNSASKFKNPVIGCLGL